MNKKLRAGKSSELAVASQLIREGLDVYVPCVDDHSIDLVIRAEVGDSVVYYDVQVKSVAGYNRIIGVSDVSALSDARLLIIHYRHKDKADEYFYLTHAQVEQQHIKGSDWGDLVFNKVDRQGKYANQNLKDLAEKIMAGQM
jgi:hypothetical protein